MGADLWANRLVGKSLKEKTNKKISFFNYTIDTPKNNIMGINKKSADAREDTEIQWSLNTTI